MSSKMEPSVSSEQLFKTELAPSANTEYCRLCATQFPTTELQNFSASDEESNRLFVAIHRMNSSIQRGDELPKTACKECIRLLDAVEVIVKKIAKAQATLTDVYKRVLACKPFDIKMEVKMESSSVSDSENEKSSDSQTMTEKTILNSKTESDSVIDDSENEPTDSLTTDTEDEMKKTTSKIKHKTKIKGQSERQVQNTTKYIKKNVPTPIHSSQMKTVTALRLNKLAIIPSYNNVSIRLTENVALIKSEGATITHWSDSECESTSDIIVTDTDECEKKEKLANSNKQTKLDNTVKVSRKIPVLNITTSPLYNNVPAAVQSVEMQIETASHSSKLSMLPIYNNVPTTTVNNEAPVKCEDPTLPRWSDFFCCRRCNHRAQSLQDLRKHSWQIHKLCIVFNCVKCSGPGINLKKFLRHMRLKHHSALEQCCEFCNECFVSSSEVRFHKELEHADEAKPHKCKSCGSTFDLPEELQSHRDSFIIVKAKQAGDRRFKCAVCDKEFLNKITLESHLRDEHDPTKKICPVCGKKFTSKYNLKYHIEVVHNKVTGKHICHICGKEFHASGALKRHLFTHAGLLNYLCGICNKKFANNSSLKQHQVTHTGAKPHVCTVCGKSFKFHNGLKLHMRTHSGVKPYSCEMCNKNFTCWGNYNKHMKRIHQQDMSKRKVFKNFNISDIAELSIVKC